MKRRMQRRKKGTRDTTRRWWWRWRVKETEEREKEREIYSEEKTSKFIPLKEKESKECEKMFRSWKIRRQEGDLLQRDIKRKMGRNLSRKLGGGICSSTIRRCRRNLCSRGREKRHVDDDREDEWISKREDQKKKTIPRKGKGDKKQCTRRTAKKESYFSFLPLLLFHDHSLNLNLIRNERRWETKKKKYTEIKTVDYSLYPSGLKSATSGWIFKLKSVLSLSSSLTCFFFLLVSLSTVKLTTSASENRRWHEK